MKHGTRGTQQRVNKHSRDNWCQKSLTFLWSFVCSEKNVCVLWQQQPVSCDQQQDYNAHLFEDNLHPIFKLVWVTIVPTDSSLTSQLLSRYCLSELEIKLCVFLFFITACGVRGPAKARRISHICDWVLRDRDNVWHCGSKLIPARIIIRSSSDKSVMICDTQRDRDLAASQRCERLCYLESGWVSWYSSLSETIKTFIKLENRGENN